MNPLRTTLRTDLPWLLPLSLALGALLTTLQPGAWLQGWFAFTLLTLLALTLATRTLTPHTALPPRLIAAMVALAFILRFAGGLTTYTLLPRYGFQDPDDRAGYIYTDAHRRDDQAWQLAASGHIIGAFNQSYAYDQYGGLLSASALLYRTLSPDAHRPLLLVLLSAAFSALGLPFFLAALARTWNPRLALAAGWIYTLYPESILLGGSAMREPFLLAFSAFTLWGFIAWQRAQPRALIWLALGLLGMLLVSPAVALITLLILSGWLYFSNTRATLPSWVIPALLAFFTLALFTLSAALTRQGNLTGDTPLAVIYNFIREAFKWNVFKIEQSSGWVQKLFDQMPPTLRLPFVMLYGVFQPVLPAALVEPTTPLWRIIAILRALGWYALLPALLLAFPAAFSQSIPAHRRILLWLTCLTWGWILFAALRGGGDQWDNPRYRAILFLWQALLAGAAWHWWRQTRSPWLPRILSMEAIFLLFFGQWYAYRYYHLGIQLPFGVMVAAILLLWLAILLTAFKKHPPHGV